MNFFDHVYTLVRRIPSGKVSTYGEVAKMISTGRAARAVGWALRALPEDANVPWQRVVGRDGMITIVNMHASKQLQIDLLRREGIAVSEKDGNYFVDLDQYLWHPDQ